MKRFIEGQDRTQVTLLPECLEDYVAEDNPVRVIDVFVDELDLGKLGFQGVGPLGNRPTGLSPLGAAQDLYVRLPQPDSVQPAPGARGPTQRRSDVADRAADARLQDDCQLSQGQRQAIRSVCRQFVVLCRTAGSVLAGRSWPSTGASSRR